MILEFENTVPNIDKKTYIASGVQLVGNVTIKEYASIWHNAVIRGDVNSIEIGRYTNIQDNSVVHSDDDSPTVVGDFVTVGHSAILHGCIVEDYSLIGMGAIVLNNAVIGKGSIIAAGALVKENEVIPPFSMVAGIPGKIIKRLPEDITKTHEHALSYKELWAKRYGFLIEE